MLRRLSVEEAISLLRADEIIIFPTETSYALGCRAFSQGAVSRLVEAKGRPDGKPLPVLLPAVDYLEQFAIESPLMPLARKFWPGALTVVIPCFPNLAREISAHTNMVGVRMSAHPMAIAITKGLGEPVVATSANVSGMPAAVSAADCDGAELSHVRGLLDGGTLEGDASTVVGLLDGELEIFREGRLARDLLNSAWRDCRTG